MAEWMRGNEREERRQGGDLGGTMRLGAYTAALAKGSQVAKIYGDTQISERHRHRSEEHTSELQSPDHLVCRLLLEKKKIESATQLRRSHYDVLAPASVP